MAAGPAEEESWRVRERQLLITGECKYVQTTVCRLVIILELASSGGLDSKPQRNVILTELQNPRMLKS